MMSSVPPSASTKAGSQGAHISVARVEQGGKCLFTLTFQAETVPLIDSGSLNRWAAVGIIDRHKISVSPDGVHIDGRPLLYADSQAAAELERILNRPQAATHPPTHPRPAAGQPLQSTPS